MTYFIKPIVSLVCTALILVCPLSSCKKWLEAKPSSDVNVPDTLEKMEMMLNNKNTLNNTPGLNDISADNLFLTYPFWNNRSPTQHLAYIWARDIYVGDTATGDYDLCSAQILIANMILEGLNKITRTSANQKQFDKIKGQALFFRSCAYFYMSQLYAKIYDPISAETDPGIPLRLSTSLNEKPGRSSVRETYHRIIQDLKAATPLLNEIEPSNKNLPSKPAAYGMLARIYQSMSIHDTAALYADSCLQLYNNLLDYNSLDISSIKPFNQSNPEIIFETTVSDKADALFTSYAKGLVVDSVLYQSYTHNDLRVNAFYTSTDLGPINFKRGYTGVAFPFSGLATDEMYLIRAESHARAGNIAGAMSDLNTLLINRWKQNTFIPFIASTAGEALHLILQERRKELPLRGLRWTDLRRLNNEGYGITPKRKLNDSIYVLSPNDRLYVLPFPPDVIKLTGIQQNPR